MLSIANIYRGKKDFRFVVTVLNDDTRRK